jgi:hypothetical protein
VLKITAFKNGFIPSTVSEAVYSILDSARHGMRYELFDGAWTALPDFQKLKPIKTGTAWSFDPLRVRVKEDGYGIVFSGKLNIPKDGDYVFYLRSDDGSRFSINGKPVVVNDGLHGPVEVAGKTTLKAGLHPFRVDFFEATGGEALELAVEGSGIPKQPLPPHWLFK